MNQRRSDLRGAVSIRIRATCVTQQEVIGDIFGLCAQTRKEPVTYTSRRLHGVRTFTLSEQAELGEAKPAALQVLRSVVQLLGGDTRIIAGPLAAVPVYGCPQLPHHLPEPAVDPCPAP